LVLLEICSSKNGTNWPSLQAAITGTYIRLTEAPGDYSTAMGASTIASGISSTAMGASTIAFGPSSTAMGASTIASGPSSTATGENTEASANRSTAMGYGTKASGTYSVAIGTRATTNGHYGSMVLTDFVGTSGDSLKADLHNRFFARFDNGYKLYTNNDLSASSIGLMALGNANSWSSISDSTKKENFIPSNGEHVLKSVSEMRIGTWNYKGQSPIKYRHWGVMAQDFHHHFGEDAYGTIGNDTTLATADFDGVSFAAIKALEARTSKLQKDLTKEKSLSASLEQKVEALEFQMQEQSQKNKEYATLKNDFRELRKMLMTSVAVKED
jgi:hypothetical protein